MRQRARVRMRATVHYDGAEFHGWQSQPERRTVQDEVEAGLARVYGEPADRVRVLSAGRTDAGVHAAGQEIAFDAAARWSAGDLRRALNANLPADIWIERMADARSDFHPRFDATGRRYEYLIADAADAASPLRRGRAWAPRRCPAEEVLRRATRIVPGERSFAAFARSGQRERGTRCRVERAEWARTPAGDLELTIVADRFLHHMVRYLVGTLVEIACGEREEEQLRALLDGASGARPPRPAPPHGLYLTGVRYPEGWNRPPGVPGVRPAASAATRSAPEEDRSPLARRSSHG